MDDAGLVGLAERAEQLLPDGGGAGLGQPPLAPEHVEEVLAVEVLHGQVEPLVRPPARRSRRRAMVCGWERRETTRASVRKRAASSGSRASGPRRIFTQRALPIRTCSALKTELASPSAMGAMSR